MEFNELIKETKNLRVLYVEDYEEARNAMLFLLRNFFDDIIIAENGEDGLEKFKLYKPDIVITDIEMPIMNGIEMSEKIRELDEDVPILFVTAYQDKEYLKASIKLKVVDYINKPFDISQMKDVFSNVVKIINKNRQMTIYLEENLHINESIDNAAIMQSILISEEKELKEFCEDAFVIWKPKDKVGGDIWIFERLNEDEALLFVLDGVGHGISGGFVASILRAIENRVIDKCKVVGNCSNTSYLMRKIYEYINEINRKVNDEAKKLNFDGAILYLNIKDKTVYYTNSNIYLCKIDLDKNLEPAKKDRLKEKKNLDFHIYSFDFNGTIYISTDGYFDQLNENDKPLGKKRVKEFLLSIYEEDMETQKNKLLEFLENYKKDVPQIDDITFIGIKLKD